MIIPETRTQTFIYLTNNVYNYVPIVQKIFNKPGEETTNKTKGVPLVWPPLQQSTHSPNVLKMESY